MPTLTPKQPKKPKKSHKLAWILASPFLLVIGIWALFSFVINPIWDHFDKQKFTTLDTEMRALFEEIKAVGGEEWQYENYCKAKYINWWREDTYSCRTTISTVGVTTSANDLFSLHERYYPILENSIHIKAKTDLSIYNRDYFGKRFVVNGAEKEYIEKKSGIACDYLVKLDQSDSVKGYESRLYGSDIEGKEGKLTLSLECTGTSARQSWYPETN